MDDLEVFALVAILLGLAMVVGMDLSTPGTKVNQPLDYHQIARQDATNAGIDPNLFERQINQESGFHPNAVSQAGAIGIAQIMPETAKGWDVDPHDPVASLSAAARAMAHYYATYQSYERALAAYNCGTSCLNASVSNCGGNWRACIPVETNQYIRAIMGV